MLRTIAAALIVSAPTIAGAQPVYFPPGVKPCVVAKFADERSAQRLIRRLRFEGLYITIKRPGQPERVLSEGHPEPRPGLNEGRVAVSGCKGE